jgi:class 3 adenylate cyclase
VIRIRESFGAKLLSVLLGTVGLLLIVTFGVVRSVTARQVEEVAARTTQNAGTLFEERNEFRREVVAQLSRAFTRDRRALALLDAAIRDGDAVNLAGQVEYEMTLQDLNEALLVFTDSEGVPVLSVIDRRFVTEGDPVSVASMARTVLFGDSVETQGYRVVDGTIYDLRSQYLELAFRPIGTVTFGLPIAQEDVEAIGEVGGFEACLYHSGVCVVRTRRVDDELRDAMLGSVGVDEPLRIQSGGSEWSIRSEPLLAGDPSQGQRVVAVPLDDVLAPFDSIQRALIFGGGGALLLSILFGTALSRNLTRPVKELVAATSRVAEGDYGTEVTVTSHDEMRTLADAFNDMTRGLLMRERYRSVLSKVVSQDIAEELMKGDVELGGENREMSVLFADIRGFTPLTEGMEPQAVIGLLNDCMEHLARAVDEEGGVVDKFIGDEVMAVFGAPVTQPDHARRAVAAAVRMRDGIEDMNRRRIEGGADPIAIGIGIATGVAVAGNMGSHDRMNYTVLGATVNLAARLTSEAEAGEILISAPTCRAVGDACAVTALGDRSLKGFSSDVQVYAVQSIREGVREGEHEDDEWAPTATSLGRPR